MFERMRISTITNWAYGVTVLLTGLSGAAFLLSASAARLERAAVEQHLAFDIVAEDLVTATEVLSDESRLYAMRGDSRHLEAYRRQLEVERVRDNALARVKAMNAVPGERAALAEAERNLGELLALEQAGVDATRNGEQVRAQAILFGPDYERAQAVVLASLERFRALVGVRTEAQMRAAQRESDRASLAAKGMLALTALVFLSVLYFVLRRRVAVPLQRMTAIVMRLARQDYAVEVPSDPRRDEIGDMTTAIQIFRENGIVRDRLEAERRHDQRAKDGILQMMHRLQACETLSELAEIVACFAPQALPHMAGRLYVYDEARNALSLASTWRDPVGSEHEFAPTACWGVRRGYAHVNRGGRDDVCCPHVGQRDAASLCVPLTAQGDTIGLLYFEERGPASDLPETAPRLYVELISENVALALSNLRLRQRLADMAARDALTGLLNRRRLDDAVDRLRRSNQPCACVMLDIDHFKHFNDAFGHDAGDAVIQHVAHILRETLDGSGEAFRFGGEEFAVLLPATRDFEAIRFAEAVRGKVSAAPLAHHGKLLGHVTVSLGVAGAPSDGPPQTLLLRADAALLRAKASGRNRTVVAADVETPSSARGA